MEKLHSIRLIDQSTTLQKPHRDANVAEESFIKWTSTNSGLPSLYYVSQHGLSISMSCSLYHFSLRRDTFIKNDCNFTSPVSLFQKSLKLQTVHLYSFWTWPLAFLHFWTPLNSTFSFWNHCVLSPEDRETELVLLLPPASKCLPAHTERTVKVEKVQIKIILTRWKKGEGGRSPLSVSLVTFGFDLIVPPFFQNVSVGSVCKDAKQLFNIVEVKETTLLRIWFDDVN